MLTCPTSIAKIVLAAASLLGAAACDDDDDAPAGPPPYGHLDEYMQGCVDELVDLNKDAAETASGTIPTYILRSKLGSDSLVVFGVPFDAPETAETPWRYGAYEFNTYVVPDSGEAQSGSLFAIRAKPEDYWYDPPHAYPLSWLQLNLYAPVIGGSRGRGLERLLRPDASLAVGESSPFMTPDTLPAFGASLGLTLRCVSSDVVLAPAPNGDNSIVVTSFETFQTSNDSTYRVVLEFDLELYGGREIVDDLLPWTGSLTFEYVEDND